jgi:histidinol phosphatase-like PHP family hydrolase
MERTCARAAALGLPAVAFTEHADFTACTVTAGDLDERLQALVTPEGSLTPPELDLSGYLECVQRCRDQFPGLLILSGVELGEAHWHSGAAAKLVAAGQFDRVLGSLHCLPAGERFAEPPELYRHRPGADVVREYLAEVPRLVRGSDVFAVLAHIDYPVRYWPAHAGPFDPAAFEEERPGAGDQHPAAAPPADRSLVARGARGSRYLRKRRSPARRARARLRAGGGHGRGQRLPARPPPLRLLDTLRLSSPKSVTSGTRRVPFRRGRRRPRSFAQAGVVRTVP